MAMTFLPEDCIRCAICNKMELFMGPHLEAAHGLTVLQYQKAYPKAPVVADVVTSAIKAEKNPRRSAAPDPGSLMVRIGGDDGILFPVLVDVPSEVCLPLPAFYKEPGGPRDPMWVDIAHASVAIRRGRALYIHGEQGTGKDAFVHALCARARIPSMMFQIMPATDVQAWLFSRAFNEKGTFWEEGPLLKALRDGYRSPKSGKVHPYLILITDFDRADASQAEILRLIMDGTQGRIPGPGGQIYPVLEGTRIVVTANTSGGGDDSGMLISSKPLDSSILDRFGAFVKFRGMSWAMEESICREAFPLLVEKAPGFLEAVGKATVALRAAVKAGQIYGHFSHRRVRAWCEHAEDLIACGEGKVSPRLIKRAARVVLDGFVDEQNRETARRIMDPHISGGTLDEGGTGHLGGGDLTDF